MSKNHFAKTHGLCNLTLLNSWLNGTSQKKIAYLCHLNQQKMTWQTAAKNYREIDAQKNASRNWRKHLNSLVLGPRHDNKAEEYFDTYLGPSSNGTGAKYLKVSLVCRLHCRQAFYQSEADIEKDVKDSQERQGYPHGGSSMGAYKLWLMMIDMYGRNYVMGRDRFFVVLRRHGLMLPPPRPRHTTNSNHRYHKWKNLIKDIILTAKSAMGGRYYLHSDSGRRLLSAPRDRAYSHKVVGWVLSDTLRASASIEALRQAIKQAVAMTGSNMLKGLTHHSDRGVQYCCDAFVPYSSLMAYPSP
jgi:hypothetical protein